MTIKRRIKLNDANYYISCDCEYKLKDGINQLCLKNYHSDYYDGGDLSILITKVEKNYNREYCKKYDGENWLLSDCLYIYENIPFISGIENYYLSADNIISSYSYIAKEEIDKYIKENNIKMKDQTNFKLGDERTWGI